MPALNEASSARPSGRARIETSDDEELCKGMASSARPSGRARIETVRREGDRAGAGVAPVLRGGRGLKL